MPILNFGGAAFLSQLAAILSRLSLRRMSTAAAAPVFDPKVSLRSSIR